MQEEFQRPMHILNRLIDQGYEAYFVGGAIRDMLLERTIGDVDIATSAQPEEVMNLFSKTVPVGIEHGTVVVLLQDTPYEVTTFRMDEEYVDYRRPKEVTFIKSLHEDLKRRDFTMNAIAMDREGVLIDPFEGQASIQKRLIQTVGDPSERFHEDALRMLRAVRFHSQLSFQVEADTLLGIKKNAEHLKHVSIERITTEFEKILKGKSCHTALALIIETGLVDYIVNVNNYKDQLMKWEKVDTSLLLTRAELWALFCYFLQVKDCESFLMSWKLPTKVIKQTTLIVDSLVYIQKHGWTKILMYKLGIDLALSTERVKLIVQHQHAQNTLDIFKETYMSLPIFSRTDLQVKGTDIIMWSKQSPGPWVAKTIERIEEAVVNGKIRNDKEQIKEWLNTCNLL
ncbi:CCA tRNA nucleotidyltransferase [Bacillus salitolerans]|uniref:CCA tRNA nucleotidyltransferase n=1 Tax=Bacillus salitolerans TaxID=1437434 RepID=UPI003A8D5E4B